MAQLAIKKNNRASPACGMLLTGGADPHCLSPQSAVFHPPSYPHRRPVVKDHEGIKLSSIITSNSRYKNATATMGVRLRF